MAEITAALVKELRELTGLGMMECKKALTEAGGDLKKAEELLRIKSGAKAGKAASRIAAEGVVAAWLSADGKLGTLAEVNCETDFVAKNEDFIAFAREIAMHIAASPQTKVIAPEDVSEEDKAAEVRVFEQQAADKPENIRPKIVEGMLNKWLGEVALLNQVHVNADKHESKTIEQLRADLSAKTGENVVIRRFTRFAVGE